MDIRSRQGGFSLVEMVVVVVLLGILAAIGVTFIVQPFQARQDISRRAQLVDEADTALTSMVRDIRRAVPNSVRELSLGAGRVGIELVPSVAGGRYRTRPDDNGQGDILDFTTSDTSFEVLSEFEPTLDPLGHELVIYNVSPAWVYAGDNRAAVTGWNAPILSFTGTRFPHASPGQRFQLVESPVGLVCDLDNGHLSRHEGYGFHADPPTWGTLNAGSVSLLATRLGACAIDYDPGTDTRHGLLRLRLVLSRDGERVELLKQVPVLNSP